ncbi:hypothetical protein [Streptomyces sp. NPDC101132]|uniref:hypothetical protein n=1 Tax=Streptomyces sp. NPDC101132 TaxID=3366110 RepID=UPI0038198C6B
MPLSQTHPPRTHRARRRRRHAGAARTPGRRAVRRLPLLTPGSGRARRAQKYAVLVSLAVALTVAARAGALTSPWEFLDFGAGVLSLVSLTATVLWGLVATDRTVLGSGHRLLAQGIHRGLAVAGLGFLALHIWVKVAEGQTGAASVVLPFADRDRPLAVGLGTLAGYLFVSVAVSGAVRSAFATRSRSMWWRALHMGAYPAWGASLVHGLKAGRSADAWVTASYGLCLAGVAAVIAVRLRRRMRRAAPRPADPPPKPAFAPDAGTGFVTAPPVPPDPAAAAAAAVPAAPPEPADPPEPARGYVPEPAAAYAPEPGPGYPPEPGYVAQAAPAYRSDADRFAEAPTAELPYVPAQLSFDGRRLAVSGPPPEPRLVSDAGRRP